MHATHARDARGAATVHVAPVEDLTKYAMAAMHAKMTIVWGS